MRLRALAAHAREVLRGRVVWHVNATDAGGGVAEQLRTHLAYGRGAGVVNRWLVLDGDPEFFAITKRVHNQLHGVPGDGGPLGAAERDHYRAVLAANASGLEERVSGEDIVVLHDPQTAGLVGVARRAAAAVVWRCHVGRDETDAWTDRAWAFLREHVEEADSCVFSRAAYAPGWLDPTRVRVIAPSIDPLSAKNAPLTAAESRSLLMHAAPDLDESGGGGLTEALSSGHRMVVQVSRWDRLKDMAGVMTGFGLLEDGLADDVHLVLAGPQAAGVSDDPEGAEVLVECRDVLAGLPAATKRRTHLLTLPMDDLVTNARLVNALQRSAEVVVQKSLVEGFGLTVAEAMWKGRAVVASRVGGIQDQIRHGRDGLLLDDPADLEAFARTLDTLLSEPGLARRLGHAAHERVLDEYVGDRHLERWADLFVSLVAGDAQEISARDPGCPGP